MSVIIPTKNSSKTFILDLYQSHLLKSNDVVLDLGSTTGDFGILASRKVGPAGKIIAVEPNSNDYEILQENIRRNKCLNVISFNIGAADKRGIEEIKFREKNSLSKQRLWITFSNPCLMLGTLIL